MTETTAAAPMQPVRPTFGKTWRFAFAIYWKFLAIIFLFTALFHFSSYVVPFGQIEFWGASVAYRISSTLEIAWLTPEAIWLCWAASITLVSIAAQFIVFNLLVTKHLGKRFRAIEIVMREGARG